MADAPGAASSARRSAASSTASSPALTASTTKSSTPPSLTALFGQPRDTSSIGVATTDRYGEATTRHVAMRSASAQSAVSTTGSTHPFVEGATASLPSARAAHTPTTLPMRVSGAHRSAATGGMAVSASHAGSRAGPAPAAAAEQSQQYRNIRTSLPMEFRSGSMNLLVSSRQRGNPVLQYIRQVAWEFAPIKPDFVMSTLAALVPFGWSVDKLSELARLSYCLRACNKTISIVRRVTSYKRLYNVWR